MKRTLLSVFIILIASALSAQVCIPDPQYADEPFGIWPTPEEGFEVGIVDEMYTQIINFKLPSDPSEIPDVGGMAPEGSTIDSVVVVEVSGIPPGLVWQCQSHTGSPCTFLPNVPGCGVINGIPTEAGVYDLTISLLAYVNLGGGIQFPIPTDYEDFQITVEEATFVEGLERYGFDLEQNMPNPFSDETVIEFSLNQPQMIDFNVFNLLGKNIHSRSVNASQGVNRIEMNAGELNMAPGIYLYSMTIDGQSVTRKMIVK